MDEFALAHLDPAAVTSPDEQRRTAFASALRILTRWIELCLNLPLEKIDRLALKKCLVEIGRS